MKTNPNAILTCLKNSIFTNVGETADGGFYWEGLEDETPAGTEIISWTGERYKLGEDKTKKSSHPNYSSKMGRSRGCTDFCNYLRRTKTRRCTISDRSFELATWHISCFTIEIRNNSSC